MNPFEMVVLIVFIVTIGSVLRARMKGRPDSEAHGESDEAGRLREEVHRLKDRLAVLERITVEKENSLEREIERLRDER